MKLKLGKTDLSCGVAPEKNSTFINTEVWERLGKNSRNVQGWMRATIFSCNLLNALISECPVLAAQATWGRSREMFLRTKIQVDFVLCLYWAVTELCRWAANLPMMLFKTSIIYWFLKNTYLLMTLWLLLFDPQLTWCLLIQNNTHEYTLERKRKVIT